MSIFTLEVISFLDAPVIVAILCSIAEIHNMYLMYTLAVVTYQIPVYLS